MKNYLIKNLDWQKEEIADQYDELPLWSAPFGMLLMNNFPIGNYSNYLDVGFGTGFPLIDFSQRLGSGCKAQGVDSWKAAVKRARGKIKTLGLTNIVIHESDASNLAFPDEQFDLITSNLGLNNFENPVDVLSECYRVLKTGSSFCTTTNLNGTFKEFYEIFKDTLTSLDLFEKYEAEFTAHVNHRGTIESMRELLVGAGFKIKKQIESSFQMRFLNGTTFLNHTMVIVGFISPWRNMIEENDKEEFFEQFEKNLNKYSDEKGELSLTIPMVYFECGK